MILLKYDEILLEYTITGIFLLFFKKKNSGGKKTQRGPIFISIKFFVNSNGRYVQNSPYFQHN